MSLKCNMGYLDRAVRLVVGAALLYLSLVNTDLIANQVVRYILLVLGSLNAITALVAFCPMYTLAHIDTRRHRQ